MNEEDEENLQKKQEQEQETAQTPPHLPLISKNDLNPIPDLNEILLVSGDTNDAKEMKLMIDLLRDEDEQQEMVVDHDDETPQPQSPLPRIEVIDSSSQLLSDNDLGAKVDEVKVEMVTGEPNAAVAQTVPSPPKKGMDIVVTRLNSFFLLCIVPLLIIFCKQNKS